MRTGKSPKEYQTVSISITINYIAFAKPICWIVVGISLQDQSSVYLAFQAVAILAIIRLDSVLWCYFQDPRSFRGYSSLITLK